MTFHFLTIFYLSMFMHILMCRQGKVTMNREKTINFAAKAVVSVG